MSRRLFISDAYVVEKGLNALTFADKGMESKKDGKGEHFNKKCCCSEERNVIHDGENGEGKKVENKTCTIITKRKFRRFGKNSKPFETKNWILVQCDVSIYQKFVR